MVVPMVVIAVGVICDLIVFFVQALRGLGVNDRVLVEHMSVRVVAS